MYTLGGNLQTFWQANDYPAYVMVWLSEEQQYINQHMKLILDALDRDGNIDILDWVLIGNHYA